MSSAPFACGATRSACSTPFCRIAIVVRGVARARSQADAPAVSCAFVARNSQRTGLTSPGATTWTGRGVQGPARRLHDETLERRAHAEHEVLAAGRAQVRRERASDGSRPDDGDRSRGVQAEHFSGASPRTDLEGDFAVARRPHRDVPTVEAEQLRAAAGRRGAAEEPPRSELAVLSGLHDGHVARRASQRGRRGRIRGAAVGEQHAVALSDRAREQARRSRR